MHENKTIEEQLADSYSFCQQNAKEHSNFYLGILLSSAPKRKAMFAIYAWLQAINSITDTNEDIEQRLKNLDTFYQTTCVVVTSPSNDVCDQYKEPFWPAFRDTFLQYHIPYTYLQNMINGQKQDLVKTSYHTFAELYDYCRQVAANVGLMCIHIWGHTDLPHVKKLAEECGVALHLTNILRDMREDVALGRVYLPAQLVDRNLAHLTATDFYDIPDKDLMHGIDILIHKANIYYECAKQLYPYIDRDSRLSFLMLMESYYSLFKKIQQNPAALLHGKKFRLNKWDKLKTLVRVFWKHYTSS